MLEHISNIWNNYINNLKESAIEAATQKINETIGSGLVALGTHIEEVAIIIIALGALLWICKNTKVFRWGCISYALGLLIELIGSSMIK
ncbi:MAG: hypothetical protein LLF98_06385 [Clostridium sp.]|uniref:hypothetical protein n=1 Tax=Clostridium sp. TaxID=1506 RepID=UPI0025BC1595|nr:hypothetical protein [Clostridium sp.]MCE5220893.1 hypothetical protein [Clostridium sp.]